MQQKAAQELINGYGHQFLAVGMRIIFPPKSHFAVGKRNQSMIGDGNTMCIARQILQHMLHAAKGFLGINHPLMPVKNSQEGLKSFFVRKDFHLAGKTKLPIIVCALEPGDKLAAEHAAQNAAWKKEPIVSWPYPCFMVRL